MINIPSDLLEEYHEFSEFLRSCPLYTKFRGHIPKDDWGLHLPIYMHLYCDSCGRETAFQRDGGPAPMNSGGGPAPKPPPPSVTLRERTKEIEFECVTCRKGKYNFYIHFYEGLNECMKIGQVPPPWEDNRDERVLVKFLPRQRELWRRARYCEMSGLGLAANAYYRNLLEDSALELLEKLITIMPEGDRAKLEPVARSLIVERKIKDLIRVVQAELPLHLKQRGVENALTEMYEILSSNIHAGLPSSTTEVLEVERTEEAGAIRNTLIFLLNVIATGQEEVQAFEEGVKKLRKIRERHVAARSASGT